MYSKPYNRYNKAYKECKKRNKNLSKDYFYNHIYEFLDFDNLDARGSSTVDEDCKLWLRVLNDEGVVNYFIEDNELLDFLFNTHVEYNDQIFKLFEKYISSNIIAIHHKNKKMSSLLIHGFKNRKKNEYRLLRLLEKTFEQNYDGDAIINMKEQFDNKKNIKHINFIYNFLMYLNTFPESIIDGPPEEVKEQVGSTVKIHNSLKINGTISPHFRRGHFRFLKSERYTKKRGMTVFVKPTFVKGEAKTVKTEEGRHL